MAISWNEDHLVRDAAIQWKKSDYEAVIVSELQAKEIM